MILALLRKDLLIEWRGRGRGIAMAAFALMLVLLFSFAVGPDTAALQRHAAGYVVLALLTASTLTLNQSFAVETESGALEGLVLLPVSPVHLYYGKAVANLVVLCGLALVATLSACWLFDIGLPNPMIIPVMFLTAAGIAAPGTLYAGLTARLQAQQIVMPLLLFPLLVPALLAASKAGSLVLGGDPMGQAGSWMALLTAFDVVYWALCGVLFTKVIDE